MALEKNIKINVDTKGAVAETDKLTKSFKEVDAQAGKTSKSVDDVASNGGAIAVLDNLTGGLATRLKDAYEATKLFNLSLKGMRTALIATGIGALIVGVGLLIAYWDDIVRYIEDANAKLEEQNKLIDGQLDIVKLNLKTNELLEKSLTNQGKSVDEILKVRDKILQSEQLLLVSKLQNLIQQRALLKTKAEELSFAQRIGEQELKNQGIDIGESKADISEEDRLALLELDKQITETNNALIELGINRALLGKPIEKDTTKDKEENVKPPEILGTGGIFEDTDVLDAKAGRIQEFYKQVEETDATYWLGVAERQILEVERQAQADIEELRALGAHKDLIADIERQAQEKVSSIARKAAEDRGKSNAKTEIKWAELTAAQKLAITGSLLGDLAGLVDKNSIAGKGIAIAQTGINTAQGIMQAFATLPTVPAIVAAALVGATGIAQTIKIAKTKIPSATGSGFVGGGVGGGGGAPKPPAFNLVQGTKSNQIADSVQSGTQPVKAYVTSKDVTSRQEMYRNIEGGASL